MMLTSRGSRVQLRDTIRSVAERKLTTQMSIATVGALSDHGGVSVGHVDALSLATAGLCHEVGGWTIDFTAIASGGFIWPE